MKPKLRTPTLMFGSEGEVLFDPHKKPEEEDKRVSRTKAKFSTRSGNTLKLPTLNEKEAEKMVRDSVDDRFTTIADGEELLDRLLEEEKNNEVPLTNEVIEALFEKKPEEKEPLDPIDDPSVPSRPAGEFQRFTPESIEPVPGAPTTEVPLSSNAAPIQQRRQLINKRTRSILASVGLGVAIGLAGVAAYQHYSHLRQPEQNNQAQDTHPSQPLTKQE